MEDGVVFDCWTCNEFDVDGWSLLFEAAFDQSGRGLEESWQIELIRQFVIWQQSRCGSDINIDTPSLLLKELAFETTAPRTGSGTARDIYVDCTYKLACWNSTAESQL
ncbi:hypothetical protein ABW21_db0206885 [Orbilia brochopaga]|nr:hypothetical protein ABW21_db0206885 [Drechslerella brochopaga]